MPIEKDKSGNPGASDKPSRRGTTMKTDTAKPAKPLRIEKRQGEEEEDAIARFNLRPSTGNAVTIQAFTKTLGDVELPSLIVELDVQAKEARNGNLSRPESMLAIQAHTLDALFNCLAQKAALNMGEYIGATETYMRLALKAQSQCRTTLETLAAIKNPPIVYARQANVTTGPQQINNGTAPPSRMRENEIEQSQLLEHTHGERLDSGATAAASGIDPAMATLGAFNRAEN